MSAMVVSGVLIGLIIFLALLGYDAFVTQSNGAIAGG